MNHISPPDSLPPGSTVDAYLRDSGGPRQDASTAQQLAEIEAYCALHGLALRHAFIDAARSGSNAENREQFNLLIDTTRRPEDRPPGLLLWNYARFARDLDDAIYYKALLRNRGITVHSLTDPIPEGPHGRIIEFFIDISNEEKRRQTSADSRRGLRDLVLKHGCVPGTPPRGFMRQPVEIGHHRDGSLRQAHRWVPDPDMIPIIQRAFTMRAAGATLAQIHTETHLYGSINSYKTFFTNRIYIGVLEYSDLTIPDYCEPLIDLPTWEAVQERIRTYEQGKRNRRHPRRANTPYLLSGLLYCGQCGAPLSANTVTTKGRNEAYRCSRSKRKAGCTQGRLGRKTIETAVLHTLTEYILLPDSLAAIHEIQSGSDAEAQTLRAQRQKALNDQKRKLQRQVSNLTNAIAEHGHSATLLAKLTELESQVAATAIDLRAINTMPTPTTRPLSNGQIATASAQLIQSLQNSPPETVQAILRGFIARITVHKEQKQIVGTIAYYTPLTAETASGLPPPAESGYNLPIRFPPLGALPYKQTFTHPLKRP